MVESEKPWTHIAIHGQNAPCTKARPSVEPVIVLQLVYFDSLLLVGWGNDHGCHGRCNTEAIKSRAESAQKVEGTDETECGVCCAGKILVAKMQRMIYVRGGLLPLPFPTVARDEEGRKTLPNPGR